MEGLEIEDSVLVLVRPAYGRAILPTAAGSSYAMMPNGKPLHRIRDQNDPAVTETVGIFRACSAGTLREKTIALGALLQKRPSKKIKQSMVYHLEGLIAQAEGDLANARSLLQHVKSM